MKREWDQSRKTPTGEENSDVEVQPSEGRNDGLGPVAGSAGAATAADYTIKICHIGSTDDEDHKGSLVFENFIESQTNGAVEVEIYPAGQLCGNFRQCLESVQLGTCEITGTTVGGIANIFPEIQVTDLPYMFPNDRVAEKVMKSEFMDEVRKAVLEKTGSLRLMGLNKHGRVARLLHHRHHDQDPGGPEGCQDADHRITGCRWKWST